MILLFSKNKHFSPLYSSRFSISLNPCKYFISSKTGVSMKKCGHLVMEVEDGVEVRDHVEIIFPAVLLQELYWHLATLHLPHQLLRRGDESHLSDPRPHQPEVKRSSSDIKLKSVLVSWLGGAPRLEISTLSMSKYWPNFGNSFLPFYNTVDFLILENTQSEHVSSPD